MTNNNNTPKNYKAIDALFGEYEPKQIAHLCYDLSLELFYIDGIEQKRYANLMYALIAKCNEYAMANGLEPYIPMDDCAETTDAE